MPKLKKIALVVCYFGDLPGYFRYFIHSCKYNPTVDFFIITNNTEAPVALPDNVKFMTQSLQDVSRLASEKLGFGVDISYGYKLCDFKPAYGLIFEDLLKSYHFWGHSDIDVIYGNIRNFMTEALLDEYELISVRPDWVPGCFVLFKNTSKMNLLFTHSKDHQKVLTGSKHYCFDETNFAHDAFTGGIHYLQIITEIESMMHVIHKKMEEGVLKTYFDLMIIEGTPGRLNWHEGVMTYRNRFEILLYHLIYFKKQYNFKDTDPRVPDSFTISPTRINPRKSVKTAADEL